MASPYKFQLGLTLKQPAVEALFTDDLMSRFYGNFFLTLLEYNTRAFNKIVSAMVGKGKRALKVLEAGAGEDVLHLS